MSGEFGGERESVWHGGVVGLDGAPVMASLVLTPPTVVAGDGLTGDESAMLARLCRVWTDKQPGNASKLDYYDGDVTCKNLGLAFGNPKVANIIAPTVGWPAKAVDMLAERSRLDYFSTGDGDFPELRAAYDSNDMANLYRQATTSELIHSCSAFTVTAGDPAAGEGAVVVNAYSALNCAMVWDQRHKSIAYGLTITEVGPDGLPIGINLFTRSSTVLLTAGRDGAWSSERHDHSMGRPMMEPLVYRATLDRPFGKSRISRAVRSITDNAVREVLRTEVAAEIYTVPQRYFFNVDPSKLEQNFKTYWNSYMLMTSDVEGNSSSGGQFNPPGMQDHISYMSALATQLAGEAKLPVSSLGVVSDNPSSAEAIYAAKEDLIREADYLNEANGTHVMNVARLIVATADGITFQEAMERLSGVYPYFRSTDMPSRAAIADMALKEVQAIPALAGTRTFMRQLFPDDAVLSTVMSEMNGESARSLLAKVVAGMPEVETPAASPVEVGDGAVEVAAD